MPGRSTLCPATTDTAIENYDGGSGGLLIGKGAGGSVTVASGGTVNIGGGGKNVETGMHNNGGRVEVSGYTLTVESGGAVSNDNELVVCKGEALTGAGAVLNRCRIRLEGGSITGMLAVDNRQEIQSITMYNDEGTGSTPAAIDSGVTVDDNDGSGWIYEAAQVETEAALLAALDEETGYAGEYVEFNSGDTIVTDGFTVPSGKELNVSAALSLTSGTIAVNGSMRVFSTFSVADGAALNVAKEGWFEAQCSGDQSLSNAGTITVDGVLSVGRINDNAGYLYNTGALTIGEDGDLYVIPGSTLQTGGFVNGTVTLVCDGTDTGVLSGTATNRTALMVSSYEELDTAKADETYGALLITDGFKVPSDLSTARELIIARDVGICVESGAALTANGGVRIFGCLENRGTLTVPSGTTVRLRGELFNNGGDENGTISVAGTVDVYPCGMFKNYGTITISGGSVSVDGVLAWGSEDEMPTINSTAGYTGSGSIVPASRTADSWESYNALMDDETCDDIVLNFDMTITENTVLGKGVTVPDGYTLTLDGVTLTVTNGVWLNICGGTFQNNGTVIVANENDNPGHVGVNGGSVLDSSSGTIAVYGEFQFNDRENTEITGEENITYYFYASLRDLSKELYGMIGEGYELQSATGDEYAGTYADWNDMDENDRLHIAFVLNNMTDTSFLQKNYEGDENTYLEPYNRMDYNDILEVLEQLYQVIEETTESLPGTVSVDPRQDTSYICTYDYGSGSELNNLLNYFMQELGNVTVTEAKTYTVNGSSDEQSIYYKTYTQAVTVVWNTEGTETNYIRFVGCVFNGGVILKNSGKQFWVSLEDCTLSDVPEKSCDVYVEPIYESEEPVFDITDNSREIFVQLRGTTDAANSAEYVSIWADGCAGHVEDYIAERFVHPERSDVRRRG